MHTTCAHVNIISKFMPQNEPYVFAVQLYPWTTFLDLWYKCNVQKPYAITAPHHCPQLHVYPFKPVEQLLL